MIFQGRVCEGMNSTLSWFVPRESTLFLKIMEPFGPSWMTVPGRILMGSSTIVNLLMLIFPSHTISFSTGSLLKGLLCNPHYSLGLFYLTLGQ